MCVSPKRSGRSARLDSRGGVDLVGTGTAAAVLVSHAVREGHSGHHAAAEHSVPERDYAQPICCMLWPSFQILRMAEMRSPSKSMM